MPPSKPLRPAAEPPLSPPVIPAKALPVPSSRLRPGPTTGGNECGVEGPAWTSTTSTSRAQILVVGPGLRRDDVRVLVKLRRYVCRTGLSVLLGFCASSGIANAQTRDVPGVAVPSGTKTPVGVPSGGQPLPGNPGSVINIPPADGSNGGGRTNGGSDGLPDAVTVIDILRHLPHWPGSISTGGSSDPDGPPRMGPKPLGGKPVLVTDTPRPPDRVVTINPGQPFSPRPSPRSDGTQVITGAVAGDVRPREVIVTLGSNATANTVFELSQDLGLDGDTLYTSNLLGTHLVRFRIPDTRTIADVLQQLATDARVQLAQPDYVFTASGGAAKPLPVPQYAAQKLHLVEAHKLAQGKQVKIAVIDTAIDTTHPVFGGAITATFDALGDSKPEAELHGTSIAGIVSARSELDGVAPAANVLGVRAFTSAPGSQAQSYTLAILKGLDWAVMNGARVVNMSFAGPNDPLLGQAIAAAVKQGVTIVAAAGNGGPNAQPAYPGAYPNVIAVTAIDNKDALYKSANHGTYIAVAAPGVDIISAAPKGAYDISSGTSMAAAHVSGIAALMLEKNPKLTPKDIRDGLSKSARQPPRLIAEEMGAGIVDAAEALKAR
jgi:hypothetical protein